jgi:hypothetical protein
VSYRLLTNIRKTAEKLRAMRKVQYRTVRKTINTLLIGAAIVFGRHFAATGRGDEKLRSAIPAR